MNKSKESDNVEAALANTARLKLSIQQAEISGYLGVDETAKKLEKYARRAGIEIDEER